MGKLLLLLILSFSICKMGIKAPSSLRLSKEMHIKQKENAHKIGELSTGLHLGSAPESGGNRGEEGPLYCVPQ